MTTKTKGQVFLISISSENAKNVPGIHSNAVKGLKLTWLKKSLDIVFIMIIIKIKHQARKGVVVIDPDEMDWGKLSKVRVGEGRVNLTK